MREEGEHKSRENKKKHDKFLFAKLFTEKGLRAFWIIMVLIFLILWPIISKYGYFARLDTVVTPNPWPIGLSGLFFILPLASKLATYIISMDLFWKLSVIICFSLLGYGGYKLIKNETDSIYAILFTISLMMINPFVYARFIEGQTNVYRLLVIVPFWLLLLRRYFENTTNEHQFTVFNSKAIFSWKTWLSIVMLAVVWIGISLHAVFMILLSVVVFALVYIPKKNELGSWIFKIVALGVGIVISSLYYIYIIFKPSIGGNISNFVQNVIDTQHLNAFVTGWNQYGVLANVLSMHGYWGERIGRFLPSYGDNILWFFLFLFMFLLIVIGRIYYFIIKKNNRKWQLAFTIIVVISVVLAMGIGEKVPILINNINIFIFNYIPYYYGMREPQKRVVFIIPFYAYFGARGIVASGMFFSSLYKKFYSKKIMVYVGKPLFTVFLIIFMLLPSIYSYKMFWGFASQVNMIEYPTIWYNLKNTIKPLEANIQKKCPAYIRGESNSCYDMLNLPRHGYMKIDWVGTNVINPLPFFFNNLSILSPDNIEMGSIYTQTQCLESRFVDSYLGPSGYLWGESLDKEKLHNFINGLKDYGIKYIFIVKQSPWNNLKKILNMLLVENIIYILHDSNTTTLFQII